MTLGHAARGALFFSLALFVGGASAQVVGGGTTQLPNGGGVIPFPGLNQFGQGVGQNLTPQQLQSMMMLRALQSRGRRGIQTGSLQNIPLGTPFVGDPFDYTPEEQPKATRKTASQKKADARQTREEQKRAERERGKGKKAKAVKKVPADEQKQAAKD